MTGAGNLPTVAARLPSSFAARPLSRVFSRPDFLAGVRDMTPPLLGLLPFGLVCGVGAQSAGASVWQSLGLSAFMFSGAAQILATQLIAAGAPVAVTILTCFVVGLRFLMYSAAMAPHLKGLPPRWRHASAFLLTDQAFAAGIRRFRASADQRSAASYFLGAGLLLWAMLAGLVSRRLLGGQRHSCRVVARLRRAVVLPLAARADARGSVDTDRGGRGQRRGGRARSPCRCACR